MDNEALGLARDLAGQDRRLSGRLRVTCSETLAYRLLTPYEVAPAESVVYRTNSPVNQLVAARAGIGLAVLPCYLGDPEPGLARALPRGPVPALTRELWIVTHQDLRRTARVRAFFDAVAEGIGADRALVEGGGTESGG